MDIYQSALRPLLFNLLKADPEFLHQQTIRTLSWWEQNKWLTTKLQQSLCFSDRSLEQQLWGQGIMT